MTPAEVAKAQLDQTWADLCRVNGLVGDYSPTEFTCQRCGVRLLDRTFCDCSKWDRVE